MRCNTIKSIISITNISNRPCFDFLDLRSFHPDHEDNFDLNYLLVGHPASRTILRPDIRKITHQPFIFLSNLYPGNKRLEQFGFRKLSHQFLVYRRRRIFDYNKQLYVIGVKPNGTSGSFIWRINNLTAHDSSLVSFHPTSMVIEWDTNYLIATRINVITEAVRKAFNVDLYHSRLVQVNLHTSGQSQL